jgi:TIR domain-containing protein
MTQPDLTQLNIEIIARDATEEDIDLMTRQLLSELRETDVESAKLTNRGEVPLGTKSGDAITVGSIMISALPTVLPAVVGLVQAWAARGQGRAVKFKGQLGGGMVEFEGSAEELQRLIASLEAKQPIRELQPAQKKDDDERKAREDTDRLAQAPVKTRPARSARIFISYRRADSADVTGRIYDRLAAHFGESAIYKDVDSIPAGTDFKEHLEKAVGKCKIFLVVIGDKWLEMADSLHDNRLQDPRDFVRIEIEAALNRNILIIPLLVRGAAMPAEEKLPSSLRKLVYRNGIPVRPDPDFHRDMDRLIAAISDYASKRS